MHITQQAREELEAHVGAILEQIGIGEENGTKETPRRFVDYLLEYRQELDINGILGKKFPAKDTHNLVAQSDIPFRMVCEHHLLPALGRAYIGYVPGKFLVGLSKLTRLVQAVGVERPSLQEHICDRIANIIDTHLEPKGAIVVIKAEHGCMACRGINTPGVTTVTSSVRGIFRDVAHARSEFFSLISL